MLKVSVKGLCTCTANAMSTDEIGIRLLAPAKHNYNEYPILFNESIFSFSFLMTIFNEIDTLYDLDMCFSMFEIFRNKHKQKFLLFIAIKIIKC